MKYRKWNIEDIENRDGRVAIVTGANSGLGYHTTIGLVSKGITVVMVCRNLEKGEMAKRQIEAIHPGSRLFLMKLDLADLGSVKEFSNRFHREFDRIDLLINNAGLMAIPYRRTREGFEMQFGVNHLGHFALTGHLFDLLMNSTGSRIVNVSSAAHKFGRIRFEDLHWEKKYRKWAAYGMSKLANLLFTYELARRIRNNPSGLLVTASHPGYADTELQSRGAEMEGRTFGAKFFRFANRLVAQSAGMGAQPTLYAALEEEIEQGGYYGPQGMFNMRGNPGPAVPAKNKINPEIARQLWEVSEKLTGVTIGTEFAQN